MVAGASTVSTNADRLVTLRLSGTIGSSAANAVVDPSGSLVVRPGQGGIVLTPGLGERALGWASDHLEPGATLGHHDPDAHEALQAFSCVGNRAIVTDGPAAGHTGFVFGKHGGVLVSFPPQTLALLRPGDRVTIDACGVGLAIDGERDVVFHSCAPMVASRLLAHAKNGRLAAKIVAILPAEAGGAGVGMIARQFDLDLQVAAGAATSLASELRFGDVVAISDQDHRYVRTPRRGWVTIGVIAHGQSAGGGHGLGLVTLVTGPAERFMLEVSPDATLASLMAV